MKPDCRLLSLFFCFALMGCGSFDVKEKLGLNREGPDEYRVVPRPLLTVPPEFNLRPPGASSDYVSGMPAQVRAREQVIGASPSTPGPGHPAPGSNPFIDTTVSPVSSTPLLGSADSQFLNDAGASKADMQVRQKLLDDKLNGTRTSNDPSYLFGGKTEASSEVDAGKEADRLKQDKAQNLPPTAGGDTPVVPAEDKGLLGNIFR